MNRSIVLALLALTLALASACVEYPPDPYNTEVDAPAGLDRATEIVRVEWQARVGVELPPELVPPITYYEGCLIYPDEYMAQEWYSGCIEGRYFGAGPVVHVKRLGAGPADDALAHELLHWALDMRDGDGNGEHDDPLWQEVRAVEGMLTLDMLCRAKYDLSTCDGLQR